MFRGTGIRGRVLQKALHHQHQNIYVFNNRTEHGTIDGPSKEMTLQFLKMAHFDEGGRTFTYVITLDGLMRFTETGAEFGIDMLSKHTMHSDVNVSTSQNISDQGLMTELHCILWRVPDPSTSQPRLKRRRRGPKDPSIRRPPKRASIRFTTRKSKILRTHHRQRFRHLPSIRRSTANTT